MENDEILMRFEFMDAERRKDKQLITNLQEQVSSLQEVITAQKREIKHLSAEIKKSTANLVRFDEYEEAIAKLQVDHAKPIAEIEKKINLLENTITAQRKDDQDTLNFRLLELQNELKAVNEIKKDVQSKIENDFQINQRIDELARTLADLRLKDSELEHGIKLVEDSIRIDSKRVSDLTIDLTALRKKIDEERTAVDSQREYVRKLEAQINDLVNREQLRHQEQIAFIETQSRQAIDRESFFKDLQEKASQFQAIRDAIQSQMAEVQQASRSLKKSQTEFEEINERLDRRLNEIAEMNRLMEERFRQEWLAFKADDQKRWTNYSLGQEEALRVVDRELNQLTDRITNVEDTIQNLLDQVHVINEETEKRVKGLLTLANENLSSFERSIGKKG